MTGDGVCGAFIPEMVVAGKWLKIKKSIVLCTRTAMVTGLMDRIILLVCYKDEWRWPKSSGWVLCQHVM